MALLLYRPVSAWIEAKPLLISWFRDRLPGYTHAGKSCCDACGQSFIGRDVAAIWAEVSGIRELIDVCKRCGEKAELELAS
jgi:hypothetical protein